MPFLLLSFPHLRENVTISRPKRGDDDDTKNIYALSLFLLGLRLDLREYQTFARAVALFLSRFQSRKAAAPQVGRERNDTVCDHFVRTEGSVVRSEIWRRTEENSIFATLCSIFYFLPPSCSFCASPNHFLTLREVQKEREEEEEIARIFSLSLLLDRLLKGGGETDDLRTRLYHRVIEGGGAAKHLPPLLIRAQEERSCLLCFALLAAPSLRPIPLLLLASFLDPPLFSSSFYLPSPKSAMSPPLMSLPNMARCLLFLPCFAMALLPPSLFRPQYSQSLSLPAFA